VFEKAYCQYRLNLPQDAMKTLNSAASLSLKLKELKAQILYRLERYSVIIALEYTSCNLLSDCELHYRMWHKCKDNCNNFSGMKNVLMCTEI
jgi:hypothetical protein